jgi:hypothetical protein
MRKQKAEAWVGAFMEEHKNRKRLTLNGGVDDDAGSQAGGETGAWIFSEESDIFLFGL